MNVVPLNLFDLEKQELTCFLHAKTQYNSGIEELKIRIPAPTTICQMLQFERDKNRLKDKWGIL